mgnify:CR=1 FL=1
MRHRWHHAKYAGLSLENAGRLLSLASVFALLWALLFVLRLVRRRESAGPRAPRTVRGLAATGAGFRLLTYHPAGTLSRPTKNEDRFIKPAG